MTRLTDHQLLERFRATHDPAAMNELAQRYIGLVYSAARRQVRDAHLAEDITQAVFIVLVRNAGSIRRDCILAAWLHSVTRHAVHNAMRVQSRRRTHETRKVLMDDQTQTPDDANIAAELRPHLDEAIARLPHGMRDSVVLYFFGNRTHKEVGEQLGLSEDAARKRITRALDRMREILAGRGIGVAASSLAISSALSFEAASTATAAPAGLLASTVNIALLSNAVTTSAAGGGSIAASIAQGVGRIMTLTKIKVAAAVAGAVIITGAGAMPLVSHASSFFTVPVAQHTITTLVQTNTSPAATAPSSNAFEAEVSDKIKVELLGVTSYPAGEDTWFAPNGDAIECPRPAVVNRENQMHLRPEPQQAMLIKLEKPADTFVRMEIENSTTVSNARIDDDNEQLLLAAFNLNGSPQEFSFRIGFSDMPWKTVAASEKPTEETTFDAAGVGAVTFHPVEPADQGCKVVAEHAAIRSPHQIVVTDEAGKEYKSENINIQSDGQNATVTCTFSIEPEKVKQVHLQTREFNKFVDVSNVSLEKGHATKPEMKVVEAKDK